MTFTSETPTVTGAYYWKPDESTKEEVVALADWFGWQEWARQKGGLWSEPLEPRKPRCVQHKDSTLNKYDVSNCQGHPLYRLSVDTVKYCCDCGGEIEIK